MITVIEKFSGGYRVFVKGSPDLIIDKCTKEQINRNIQNIDRNKIRNIIKDFGKKKIFKKKNVKIFIKKNYVKQF